MAGTNVVNGVSSDAVEPARAYQGEAEALESLFRQHYDMIYSMAYRLCGRREDAEDIAQETFVRAARSIGTFRGESRVTTWLCRIALNAARDLRRRNRRRHLTLVESGPAAHPKVQRPDDRSEAADTSDRIWTALASLKYSHREAIVLTVCEGLSHAQAARLAGCAEATLSWRVFMAKQRLRKILSRESVDGRS